MKLAAVAGAAVLAALAPPDWSSRAPIPVPRSEVAATLVGGEIAVVGGFTAAGSNSRRADAYSPRRNRWRRLRDLPVRLDHGMAAGRRDRLYVLGGYGADRNPMRSAWVLVGDRWRSLPRMPDARAAAGAAWAGGRLYVVGGVGRQGLARSGFEYDPGTARWRRIPGPTPREHLGVTAANGKVYAVGGRTAGFDTNLDLVEEYDPRTRRWRRLPPVPGTRGGTGATVAGGLLVSVGGEAQSGTIEEVYGLDLRSARWRRFPDLPTPRHGLGVVGVGDRVYAVAGGPTPGLSVSPANEVLRLR